MSGLRPVIGSACYRAPHGRGSLRLHHRRSGQRGLRAGASADAIRPLPRAAARSRRARPNPWIHIPLGYGKLFTDPKVNWLYQSEPEPELNNRRIIQPRGKVLGGSSSINGLLYVRGQREDFDHWRQLGNAGWSFEDVLPYFRRSENQAARRRRPARAAAVRSRVSDVSEPHPLCEAFIEASRTGGLSAQRRFQRAGSGRRGLFPAHRPQRAPLIDRDRFPQTSAAARQPENRIRRADHASSCLMAAAQPASNIASAAKRASAQAARRSDPVGRRDQFAADSAALRHRPGAASAQARHRRDRRPCRASARTCRIISRCGSSIAAPSRSP